VSKSKCNQAGLAVCGVVLLAANRPQKKCPCLDLPDLRFFRLCLSSALWCGVRQATSTATPVQRAPGGRRHDSAEKLVAICTRCKYEVRAMPGALPLLQNHVQGAFYRPAALSVQDPVDRDPLQLGSSVLCPFPVGDARMRYV
jgi:hypothetical protein